jgi:Domain of unknown function (DUF4375)
LRELLDLKKKYFQMHLKNYTQRIDEMYKEAVQDLREDMFAKPDTLEWYNYIKALPKHLKTVYVIVVLENQIINGGFDQYFTNLYGQFAFMVVASLQNIKAFEKSELVSKALKIYNPQNLSENGYVQWITKRDWIRQEQFNNDAIKKAIVPIDENYWSSKDNVVELLNQYIEGTVV